MNSRNSAKSFYFNLFSESKVFKLALFMFVVFGGFFIFSIFFAHAEELPNLDLPQTPGAVFGLGAHFEITDSEYLNIVLDSSEEINLKMESMPEMVTMMIEPISSATSTQITLRGFAPLTTYYKYQDDYHNLTEFTADANGSYSYIQDLTIRHFVFIQPRKSTKFIKDDATGGDCYLIGNWDASIKTCALTADVYETIQIDNDNIVLDGNSYSLVGNRTGNGVYVYAKNNIIIKNFTVKNFNTGIYLQLSNNNKVINNIVNYNQSFGIFLSMSDNNVLINNFANFMRYYSGLAFSSSNNNTIQENTTSNNNRYGYGIDINSGNNNIIVNNIANSNYYSGINISYGRNNAVIDNIVESSYYYAGVRLYNTNDNAIKNNNINYNSDGIWIHSYSYNNIVTNNNITYNRYAGINIRRSSYNKVYNNNFIGNPVQSYNINAYNNDFALPLPIGGNYWSNFDTIQEGCNDLNNDNICDLPYIFSGGQDNLPWTKQDGWKIPVNQPPTISTIGQYKSDGTTQITEGSITTEDVIVFKAILSDSDNDQVKLQVELKEFNQSFNEQDIIESGFINSGQTATITRSGLVPQSYHWRARAVDLQGNTSQWQEFGTAGNVDFEIKLVPLYTQRDSQWAADIYDHSNQYLLSCGGKTAYNLTIENCGCALTSAVMILRYYGINNGPDANNTPNVIVDVNPKTLNEWLKNNDGYTTSGSVKWDKIAEYSKRAGKELLFKGSKNKDKYSSEFLLSELNTFLGNYNPVIIWPEEQDHFLVITEQSNSTYKVKDPFWHETQTLNDPGPKTNAVRPYNNSFYGLRLYKPADGITQTSISFALASPAELLIIDPLGRKFGTNPASGISYNEIPEADYYIEKISDPTETYPASQEFEKIVWIPNPLDGNYDVQVIGTGSGAYHLDFWGYDNNSGYHSEIFTGNTSTNQLTDYTLNYLPDQPENIVIKPTDQISPITDISLSGVTGNNDWFISDTEVSFIAQDNPGGTGIYKTEYSLDNGQSWLIYTDPFILNENGVLNILYKSKDFVGNEEQGKSVEVKIDKELSQISTPALEYEYLYNSQFLIQFNAIDNISGLSDIVATFNGQTIANNQAVILNRPGENTLEITATDIAGNVSVLTKAFNVVYNFGGFFAPIKTDGSGIYKQGRTIPAKFRLTDVSGAYVSSAAAYLYLAKIQDGITGADEIALSTSSADTGNQFRYDTQENQYIYNLSTDAISAGTWQLKAILNDGRNYSVLISIKN